MNGITAGLVLWREEPRIQPLLTHLRNYVDSIVVCVQESPDRTLELARELADVVVTDDHHGYGDASFGPRVLTHVTTPWTIRVDGDEWPSVELMESLAQAKDKAESLGKDGVWFRFRSWTEDVEWIQYHGHLRLFKTSLGWPAMLHSRPPTDNTMSWDVGWFEHRRSTDKMVRSYLEYYRIGRGNPGWERHNLEMLHDACVGAAEHKGWEWVKAHDWWPDVRAIAFPSGEEI